MVLHGGSSKLLRTNKRLLMLLYLFLLITIDGTSSSSIASYSLPAENQQNVGYRLSDMDSSDENGAGAGHEPTMDNDTSPLKITESQQWLICGAWIHASNNFYFHVVFALLLFAFLAPANNCGWIWLRAAVVCASIVMFYAAWFHECDREKFIWAMLIFFVNFIYLSIALIKLRPLKFDKEIECVSTPIFLLFFQN